ncbi:MULTISPECIES: hypothetical protein [Prochlorococcus]|uniref:hypothetical protein n=1 Tax=Prochlorococcus TaxID=1218 RepID=UPI0005339FB0|nr:MULTISPECIES: hypothetical protein [Prochlorococcus]KGG11960.1 hypothetical protein EV05_1162 [Prochlorococcus sp. MIT 0601]
MVPQEKKSPESGKSSIQRKTTLKWGNDGELSAVDMARILEKLEKSELLGCDLTCNLDN